MLLHIHNKLFVRIIFFMVVAFMVSMGVYVTLFIKSEIEKEHEEIVENGKTFAQLSASILYQDYLTASARGFPRFQDIAQERLDKNNDITQVALIATNGKIIFDSQDFASGIVPGRTVATTDRYLTDPETLVLLQQVVLSDRNITIDGVPALEIVVPINEAGGGHIFSMRYLLSFHSLEERLSEIYWGTVITFLPLFLFNLVAGIMLARSITRPIENLSRATEKIRSGDFQVQASVSSRDEIGNLAAAFNQMVTTIGSAQQKLKEYSHNLEQQVLARTQELEVSKKELELKLTELESMNKLMIGREIKMSELKNENEQLKKNSQ